MDLDVRKAEPRDAVALAALFTELGFPATPDEIARRLDAAADIGLVAVRDSQVVGVITTKVMTVLHRPSPIGRISALVVAEHSRHLGIGRRLVACVGALIAARGCGMVEVTSNFRLEQAHAFYKVTGLRSHQLPVQEGPGRSIVGLLSPTVRPAESGVTRGTSLLTHCFGGLLVESRICLVYSIHGQVEGHPRAPRSRDASAHRARCNGHRADRQRVHPPCRATCGPARYRPLPSCARGRAATPGRKGRAGGAPDPATEIAQNPIRGIFAAKSILFIVNKTKESTSSALHT